LRQYTRKQLISFSKYGPHSPIGYGSIFSYDSIAEEYLIVDQHDDLYRRKSADIRGLTRRVKKLHGMNATVYKYKQGAYQGLFRAEVLNGEIIDTDNFTHNVSLVALRGTPAYHAYLVCYIYPTSFLEISTD
jgi:hypothetical protein